MEKHRERHRESREPWRYFGRSFVGGRDPLSDGFSWPPRSYSCTFCRREFRSAQALGGHMNVHRRDRAKLRQQSPPWDNTLSNTNPNPNSVPNLNMPPPLCSTGDHTKPSPVLYTFPSLLSPPNHLASSSTSDDDIIIRKEKEAVRPWLNMATACADIDNYLDLELRLGYP